ncbi:MAG: terpene cyclase/mutase family protein [Cellvibrionaceae bacterium]|nr:terpene cyclase/mutase family protein [Cellvibrionaceae bacterium]MCV6626313.1 terpene cyclase/mutase family protein [Cellvibrionaceae bacterium]
MEGLLLSKGLYPSAFLQKTVDYILSVQLEDGLIPWFKNHKADPWDHTEAAMGLSIAGELGAAEQAYQWLLENQLPDGSWYANYQYGKALYKEKRETNFIAYIATGVWHHYLISQDREFLRRFFPAVKKAIDLVASLQSPTGEIYWAIEEDGSAHKDALVTGCSSVYKSIECAIAIAQALDEDWQHWHHVYQKLGNALAHHPEYFDRSWESKERFSMDWFYPILAGAITGEAARARIKERWDTFVRNSMGCLCVSDEPWVTVAESCELAMALLNCGEHAKAVQVYSWLHQWRDNQDGAYWTGYQYVEKIIWPEEKTAWTAGAIILAADALTEHSRAWHIFQRCQFKTEAIAQQKQL